MLACFVLSILLVAWLASLTPEAEAAPAEAEADAEADAEPEPEPDAVLVPAEDDSARPGRRSSRYRRAQARPGRHHRRRSAHVRQGWSATSTWRGRIR